MGLTIKGKRDAGTPLSAIEEGKCFTHEGMFYQKCVSNELISGSCYCFDTAQPVKLEGTIEVAQVNLLLEMTSDD